MTIWKLAAHHENLALAISALAFLVSGLALGWNIFRDVILKPRFRVRFEVGQYFIASAPRDKHRLWLDAVNLGPGEVTIEMAVVRTKPALLAWFKKEESVSLLVNESRYELNSRLPTKLMVAKKMSVSFPLEKNCILDQNPLRIGVRDAYRRNHWAPAKDLEEAHRKYSELKASLK
jgi:hypothetical protein